MRTELKKLIGPIPAENGFKHRMRVHQGWWRAFVLAERPGEYPNKKSAVICNTILNGQTSQKNFLSPKISEAVRLTILERQQDSSGIVEEERLFNNLLSSQPLCLNFFGEFKTDVDFALQVLHQFWPAITGVNKVIFEFAPPENFTGDNSAFDVAFEVEIEHQIGLIGLECKYTDTFSATVYDKPHYRHIFEQSRENVFDASYDAFKSAKYNQLSRNQLIAEALLQNGRYDFVITGLFCHQDDSSAIQTGAEFQSMLKNGRQKFRIITYQEWIEKIQQIELSWEQRELSMLLWARYCGIKLSEQICK